MSVPRSDTETRSASFWSFNHCLLSFTLFLPCLLMSSPFILSVAKCNVVFHYSPPHFAGFISDIMPPLCLLAVTQGERDGPFRCTHHTLFTRLIHNLHCVVLCFPAWFHSEGQNGMMGNAWHKCTPPVVLMLQFCVKARETANDG